MKNVRYLIKEGRLMRQMRPLLRSELHAALKLNRQQSVPPSRQDPSYKFIWVYDEVPMAQYTELRNAALYKSYKLVCDTGAFELMKPQEVHMDDHNQRIIVRGTASYKTPARRGANTNYNKNDNE